MSSDLFDLFADDLLAERDMRPLIIIGASKVDHLLFEMLHSFFLPKLAKAKDPDELLEGDTPLATFSARTKICRRLGLIDETLYIALDRLRKLRNLSAHSVSFDHTKSPARELIAELRARVSTRGSFGLTKARYFDTDGLKSIEEMQCMMLTLCILLEAIKEKVKPTQGSKRALRISTK